jgi:2'-5' RNA ligase
VESCGVRPDDRPFQAHMTLLRKVNRPPAALTIDPIPWSVERFSLIASVPTEGGVVYRELRSWPLTVAAAR